MFPSSNVFRQAPQRPDFSTSKTSLTFCVLTPNFVFAFRVRNQSKPNRSVRSKPNPTRSSEYATWPGQAVRVRERCCIYSRRCLRPVRDDPKHAYFAPDSKPIRSRENASVKKTRSHLLRAIRGRRGRNVDVYETAAGAFCPTVAASNLWNSIVKKNSVPNAL